MVHSRFTIDDLWRLIVFAFLAAIATPGLTHNVRTAPLLTRGLLPHSIAADSPHTQRRSRRRSDSRFTIHDSSVLSGDYDYYVMLGAAPNGGFEARRRMGFAHFDGPTANGAWFKRRSGAPLYTITKVTVTGAQITMSLENGAEIEGLIKGDGIEGRIFRDGKPIDRIWLLKRTNPIIWEPNYALWPGESSRPTFQVTVDPAVPMTARDGTTLMNYVARPVGAGPF